MVFYFILNIYYYSDGRRNDDMNIQFNYSDKVIRYVKDNNIVSEVTEFLSLKSCLEILENKKSGYVYTGNKDIDIILSIINDGDTYIIYIDDICINR